MIGLARIEKDVGAKRHLKDPFSRKYCELTQVEFYPSRAKDTGVNVMKEIELNLRLRTSIISAQINALTKEAVQVCIR